MTYRLELSGRSLPHEVTYEIYAVTLGSAERAAVVEALHPDFGGMCSLTLRVAHQPDLVRRCDSPHSPAWYWCSGGHRLPKGWTPDWKGLRAWGAL